MFSERFHFLKCYNYQSRHNLQHSQTKIELFFFPKFLMKKWINSSVTKKLEKIKSYRPSDIGKYICSRKRGGDEKKQYRYSNFYALLSSSLVHFSVFQEQILLWYQVSNHTKNIRYEQKQNANLANAIRSINLNTHSNHKICVENEHFFIQ